MNSHPIKESAFFWGFSLLISDRMRIRSLENGDQEVLAPRVLQSVGSDVLPFSYCCPAFCVFEEGSAFVGSTSKKRLS